MKNILYDIFLIFKSIEILISYSDNNIIREYSLVLVIINFCKLCMCVRETEKDAYTALKGMYTHTCGFYINM